MQSSRPATELLASQRPQVAPGEDVVRAQLENPEESLPGPLRIAQQIKDVGPITVDRHLGGIDVLRCRQELQGDGVLVVTGQLGRRRRPAPGATESGTLLAQEPRHGVDRELGGQGVAQLREMGRIVEGREAQLGGQCGQLLQDVDRRQPSAPTPWTWMLEPPASPPGERQPAGDGQQPGRRGGSPVHCRGPKNSCLWMLADDVSSPLEPLLSQTTTKSPAGSAATRASCWALVV